MNHRDKDQLKFIAFCKRILALDYDYYQQLSREAYIKAANAETSEVKKYNAGVKAGNLVMLDALKEIGAEQWRLIIKRENDGIEFKRKSVKEKLSSLPDKIDIHDENRKTKNNPLKGYLTSMLDEIVSNRKS